MMNEYNLYFRVIILAKKDVQRLGHLSKVLDELLIKTKRAQEISVDLLMWLVEGGFE